MKEIIVKGQAVPIHFGMRAVNEFSKLQDSDFGENITTIAALSNLDSILSLTVTGLNEGARKSGSDKRYTEDEVWDIFDDEPHLILEVSQIFIESVVPLTDKLTGLGTDAKPSAKSGSHRLGRGAKEEEAHSDSKNVNSPAAKGKRK